MFAGTINNHQNFFGRLVCTWLLSLMALSCAAQTADYDTDTLPPAGLGCTFIRSGSDWVYLFYPLECGTDTLPVSIFLPGYNGFQPEVYGGWISDLVQRGSVVIFPVYQHSLVDLPAFYYDHALGGIALGLDELKDPKYPRTDVSKVLYIGHSLGATVAMKLMNHAGRERIPPPYAALLAHPGSGEVNLLHERSYDHVPQSALLVCLTGDSDRLAGDAFTEKVLSETSRIPAAHKYHFEVLNDDHGKPALKSDHFTPCSYRNIVPLPLRIVAKGSTVISETDLSDTSVYWEASAVLLDMMLKSTAPADFREKIPGLLDAGSWPDGEKIRLLREVAVEE